MYMLRKESVSVRVEISCRHTEHRIIIVIRHSIRALCPHASLQAPVQIHDGPEQQLPI